MELKKLIICNIKGEIEYTSFITDSELKELEEKLNIT